MEGLEAAIDAIQTCKRRLLFADVHIHGKCTLHHARTLYREWRDGEAAFKASSDVVLPVEVGLKVGVLDVAST